MSIPFMQGNQNPYQDQQQMEQRQMDFSREQGATQIAEGIPDQIMMQQQEDRTDLLRWQQDMSDELKCLIHDLRNEVYVESTGVWVAQGKPIMNDIGIRKIESHVRPFLSRNMFNTNFNEDRVLGMLRDTSNSLTIDLCMNYGVYDLDFSNCHVITRWIKNIIMAGPHRAMHGWNKKIDSTISKRVEAFSEGPVQAPKKRMFGLFG